MDISAKQVMELRAKTGVSMMAVKKALVEAEGDEEKAVELLRKRGETKSAAKSDRATGEGGVGLKIEGGKGVMVAIKCETDFVSRNDAFKELLQTVADKYFEMGDAAEEALKETIANAVNTLAENIQISGHNVVESAVVGGYVHTNGKIGVLIGLDGGEAEQARDIAMHAAAMNPMVVNPEEVTDELVEKEKVIWVDQLKQEGKPEEMIEKIMGGKEKKFREEGALMSQPFVKDSSKKVAEFLGDVKVSEYVRAVI
jgi:elongation factor Ts